MQKDVKVGLVIGLVFVTALIVFLARHSETDEATTVPEGDATSFRDRVDTMTDAIETGESTGIEESAGEAPGSEVVSELPPVAQEVETAEEPTEAPEQSAEETPQPSRESWTVKKGDTLWSIAEECYGNGKMMNRILRANRDKISDPDRLPVGIELVIPNVEEEAVLLSISPPEEGSFEKYTVKEGDTLWSLAERYYGNGKLHGRITRANEQLNSEKDLKKGMTVLIPLDEPAGE